MTVARSRPQKSGSQIVVTVRGLTRSKSTTEHSSALCSAYPFKVAPDSPGLLWPMSLAPSCWAAAGGFCKSTGWDTGPPADSDDTVKARLNRLRPADLSVVVKNLRLKDEDKDEDFENWSSKILEDKDFPRGQQHCCEAVRWHRHELESDRDTMANKPPIRHSVTARRWCLIFHMPR